MKISILAISFSLIPLFLLSQMDNYQIFGDGTPFTEALDIEITNDGGHIVAGAWGNGTIENTIDSWLLKFDQDNNLEWDLKFNGGGDLYDFSCDIHVLDEGYIFTGNFDDPATFLNVPYLVYTQNDGLIDWFFTYPEIENFTFGQVIENNGKIVIAGYGGLSPTYPYIVQVSMEGELISQTRLEPQNLPGFERTLGPYANLVALDNGDIVFGGSHASGSYLAHIMDDGTLVRDTSLNYPGSISSIVHHPDGSLYAACTETIFTNPSIDHLLKLSLDFEVEQALLIEDQRMETIMDIDVNTKGEILAVGTSFSDSLGVISIYDEDLLFLESNRVSAKDELTSVQLNAVANVDEYWFVYSGIGFTESNISGLQVSGYGVVAKTNISGDTYSNVLPSLPEKNSPLVYPNPAVDVIYIDGKNDQAATLNIFDSSGKLAVSLQSDNGKFQVYKHILDSGVFFYNFITEKQSSHAGIIQFY